jgi:hypothetical protein
VDITVIVSLVASVLVAIFASVTAPLILAHRTEKMHIADREADWEHQEEVARRAAKVAADLIASQKITADLAERTAAQTNTKLDQLDLQTKRIHTLVNSDMTAARQAQLDQARASVAILQRVIALARHRGVDPEPQDLMDLDDAQASVANLEIILADRMTQMRAVEAEQQVHPITDDPETGGGE